MPEATSRSLLNTGLVTIRDVHCPGLFKQESGEESTVHPHIVFPYRGVFVRHLGADAAVADGNQILFFNAHEGYRVSHPVGGGDACIDLVVSDSLLRELAPRGFVRDDATLAFRRQRLGIDPRAQAIVALLRHRLSKGTMEPLEAEGLALRLVRRALGARPLPTAGPARRRLVDRVKLVLAADPGRRWTLAGIAAEVGGSPVYLTQAFQQVEGVPLYRYQLRLRLARALDLLDRYDDLTSLGLDLGFSSHSHFTTVFSHTYGRSPSAFRHAARPR